MIRILAKWWGKLSYVWALEVEGRKSEITAASAKANAEEMRRLTIQLNAEADAIEKNIKEVAEKEENGYWLCQDGHEVAGPTEAEIKKANEIGTASAPGQCEQCGKYMKFIKRELMSGQEKYESDKERKEAERIIAEKRKVAAEQSAKVSEAEQNAQYLRGMAENSRAFADKIRRL